MLYSSRFPRDRRRAKIWAASAVAMSAGITVPARPARAAAVVYLYAGANANPTGWGQAGNWYNTSSSTDVGYPNATGDVAIFDDAGVANAANGAASATIITGANRSIGQIAFGGNTTGLANQALSNAADATFSINNNTITLNSTTANGFTAAIYRNATTVGTQTINSNLVLAKTGEIFNLAGSSGSVLINGVISEATANGGFTLSKLSNGTLELAGQNTFTGAFTDVAGTVIMDNAQALGLDTTDAVTVGSISATNGVALYTNSGVTFTHNVTTVADTGAVVTCQLGGATNQSSSVWTGTVTLGRDTGLNPGLTGTVEFQGVIQNGAGVTPNISKTNSGTVILSAANTFTGTYDSIGGTTVLNNSSGLATAAGIVGSGPTASFAGAFLTNAGINFAQPITVASNASAGSPQAGFTLGGVAGMTTSTWSGNIALNQATNLTGGAAGVVTFTGAIADGTGGNYIYNGTTTPYAFVSSALTKVDNGTVVLSGANTYSGGTSIAAGTLVANAPSGSSSTGTGPVTVSGGVLAGNGFIGNIAGPVTIAAGGTITAGSGMTPNDTIGTLTTTGPQAWNASGTYVAKVAPGAGATNDELVLSGGLAVNGPFTVSLLSQGTTSLSANRTLTLAYIPGAAQGTFNVSSLSLTTSGISVPAGYAVELVDAPTAGGDDLLAEVEPVAAPEPTSLLLFAAAPVALGGRRTRRRCRDGSGDPQ